jgi:hypothetical protein
VLLATGAGRRRLRRAVERVPARRVGPGAARRRARGLHAARRPGAAPGGRDARRSRHPTRTPPTSPRSRPPPTTRSSRPRRRGSTPSAGAGSARRRATTTAGSDPDAAPEVKPIDLDGDAASTYDPYDRAGSEVGDPADALDGKAGTAWEAPVGDDGQVRIGLAVSLEQARTLSRIAFKADTPGFTVEVYGTRAAKLPPDILDARWENLGTKKDVGISEELDVSGKFRHVVLWVTAQPADTKVAIPEIQLFD